MNSRPRSTSGLSEWLKAEFQSRKEKNPRYSLRAFARDIGLRSSRLSEFINGHRAMSLETAAQILSKAHFPATSKFEFLKQVAMQRVKGRDVLNLEAPAFSEVANRVAFAILAWLEAHPQAATLAEITQAVSGAGNESVPQTQVREQLARLVETGLAQDYEGRYLTTGATTSRSLSVLRSTAHLKNELVIAFDQARLADALDRLKKFSDEFRSEFGDDGGKALYSMSLHLRPFQEA